MIRSAGPTIGGMLALVAGILLYGRNTTATVPDERAALDGAIAFFEQRVIERPDDFIATHQLAGRYVARFGSLGDLQDMSRAEDVLSRGLRINPRHGPSYALMVKVHISRHEFPEALAAAQQAWAFHPRRATNGVLFDAYFEVAEYDSARAALKRMDNRSFAYLTRASRLAERGGTIDNALRFMTRACRPDGVTTDRLRAWCAVRLGELYASTGRDRLAVNRFQTALELIPDYTAAHMRLGDLAFTSGDLPAAVEHFDIARRRTVGVEALLRLADAAAVRGDRHRATVYRRDFLDRVADPLYGRAFWLPAAEALAYLAMTDSAVALVRADIDQRPGVESYTGLATVAEIIGDEDLLRLARDSAR